MGIGPSTKETTLHHFRDPLLEVVSEDTDLDLLGILLVGTPDGNEEKMFVGTRAAVMAECMRADGVIISCDGWGNSHVDYTNTVEQIGKRGIPVTGITFNGTVAQFVVVNDYLDAIFYKPVPVAIMLIVYGVLFIIIEDKHRGKQPKVTRISQLTLKMLLWIGVFQMLALIPGTSRSGATIVGALIIGVSRETAAEFTFFLAIPVMFGASFLKLLKFGLAFSAAEFGFLMLGCIVSFGVSIFAIKFLMGYIKQHDFKVFGYYRIALGVLILIVSIFQVIMG